MTTAQWSIHLDVTCPSCTTTFDVIDQGDAGDILNGVQALATGEELTLVCPTCEFDFTCKTIF